MAELGETARQPTAAVEGRSVRALRDGLACPTGVRMLTAKFRLGEHHS